MYFGGSSFAAAPFGATAGQSIRAAVSGNRVNLSTGSPTITGGVVITLSGNRINLATGTVDVISWNPIPPGVSQTWVEIDPLNP